jgi:hypothetical protein
MQALRAWWQDIVVRSDRINDDETRKSAHTVAMAYLEMAGLMEAFSNELEYVYSPECFHHGDCGDAAANLEILVDDMQATMDKIRYAIDRLDAQWAIANMEVSTHLFSNVARRGLVVNAANTLVIGMKNQWPEGMQRHEVSEEEARAIIQKLRGLAEEARAIASEIAMSLNE